MPRISLDDFKIERLTFELRFENAYLLWDKTGHFWSRMTELRPSLQLAGVQPNVQVLEDDTLQLTAELGALRIIAQGREALHNLFEVADPFVMTGCQMLGIRTFTRIGWRSIRTYTFPGKDSLLEGIQAFDARDYELPEAFKQIMSLSNARFESDNTGINGALRLEEREFKIDVPWEARGHMERFQKRDFLATFDCDYYTVGLTQRDAFSAQEWIKGADRMSRRFGEKFVR